MTDSGRAFFNGYFHPACAHFLFTTQNSPFLAFVIPKKSPKVPDEVCLELWIVLATVGEPMNHYRIFWEDHERNREVEISVDYSIEAGLVHIAEVRATRVTIYCDKTQQPLRTVGVYTLEGRRLLAEQYRESRYGLPRLEDEIYAHHQSSEEAVRV